MAPIRIAIQMNPANTEERIAGMLDHIKGMRDEPGCVQAELFRSTEFPENLLNLELWESPAAFDTHWKRVLDSGRPPGLPYLNSPYHHGAIESPRRHGQNGIEFYEQAGFSQVDRVFVRADEAQRSEYVRWPAWGKIRIIIQLTSDPNAPRSPQADDPVETRAEPGCVEFEFFRGVEYPENVALMEVWESPEIYDRHWLSRILQQNAFAAAGNAPQRPPPMQRRYGSMGFEWYNHSYYTLVDNVWVPENPAQRMLTVRW
jgi:quinol monooxygenase YgiN